MPEENNKKKKKIDKEVWEWIRTFLIAAAIAICVNSFILANTVVPTGSMIPTININDRIIGNRLAYLGDNEPKRGEIVMFKWPDNESIFFIKRVIGLPGEHICIKDGLVYINGLPLKDEYYIREPMNEYQYIEFDVPEGCYFMMGDNRNESNDSRYWKNPFVSKDQIMAKAWFRYWPSFQKIN